MENASRALLIAGSVLLGIIVLSLFMVMVNNLTSYQQSQIQTQREAEIVRFNNQYEGYMRNDVSGADVLSLINKVVFYNRTKSSAGTEDEGAGIGYMPITLIVDFGTTENRSKLSKSADGNQLFTSDIEIKGTDKRSTDQIIKTINSIINSTSKEGPKNNIKDGKTFIYTEGVLQALSENYANGKVFDSELDNAERLFDDAQTEKAMKIFADFNACVGKYYFPYNDVKKEERNSTFYTWYKFFIVGKNSGNNDYNLKNILDLYYEYSQFKRAIFKWEPESGKEVYDSNTGRVVYMKFTFTGNFI